jgi:hypothetical protein
MKIILAMAGALAILIVSDSAARPDDRTELLKVREEVWRAWFVNDTKTLDALVPPDTIVISSGEEKWKNQSDILQRFGDVAITYSQYLYETEVDGKRSLTSGRVTEIFVQRRGKWTNPGWHTDTEK